MKGASCSVDEVLGREESRRNRGVDVDDGERRTRLQHRVQGGFAPPAATISDRRGNPHDRCSDEAGDDRRKSPFTTGEDDVDLGTPGLETVEGSQESVEAGDPHVVLTNDADPELLEERTGLLGEGDIARAGREDRGHAGPVPRPEGSGDANEASVGEEPRPS